MQTIGSNINDFGEDQGTQLLGTIFDHVESHGQDDIALIETVEGPQGAKLKL